MHYHKSLLCGGGDFMGGRGANVKTVKKDTSTPSGSIAYKGSINGALMPGRRSGLFGTEYNNIAVNMGAAKFDTQSTSIKTNRKNATLNGMKLPKDRNVKPMIMTFGKNDLAPYAKARGEHLPTLQRWRERAVRLKNSREPNLKQYKNNQIKSLQSKLSAWEKNFGSNDDTVKVMRSRLAKAKTSKTGHWDVMQDMKVHSQFIKNGGKLNIWE